MNKRFVGCCMGVIALIFICLFVAEGTRTPAWAQGHEITITGLITSASIGAWTPFVGRRATIVIRDRKGRSHTVYLGHKTSYIPRREPVAGDRVIVTCIREEGVLKGLTVTYEVETQ
jgi:hypothetical protein